MISVVQVADYRRNQLRSMDEQLPRKTEELYLHMSMWMVRIESELEATAPTSLSAVLNARSKVLGRGNASQGRVGWLACLWGRNGRFCRLARVVQSWHVIDSG